MNRIITDLAILGASVVTAIVIVETQAVPALLSYFHADTAIASFLAGMFFTSVVTTAPAIAVLGELSLESNLFVVAVFGGLGAVLGDYFIFAFVRDRVSEDIAHLVSGRKWARYRALLRRRTFKRVLPFIGGFIIASPLPDELGLALLGMSHVRTSKFAIISFTFNAIGIFLIGMVARSFS
ncbi:hypothetical protein IT396_01900 [Candidatus Nomurabacteria bacterium]|nr:hypothetical protein [Candidatus Nomurabacteria bacterium]